MAIATNLAIGDYLEDKLLKHVLLITEWLHGAEQLYVHLYTSSPSQDDSGVEVSAASYVKQAAAFDAVTVGGLLWLVNNADVLFPVAAESWGTVTHIAIKDTAGNLFYFGAIDDPVAIGINNQFKFPLSDATNQYLGIHFSAALNTLLETVLLKHALLAEEFTHTELGSPMQVSLWIGDPEGAGVELTAASYARQNVTFHKSADVFMNNGAVTFPIAQEAWGVVDYYAIHYNVHGARWSDAFPIGTNIEANSQFIIPDGELQIELV